LKEIRATQARQTSEIERQSRQHSKDSEDAQKKFENTKSTHARNQAKDQERIRSRQKTEVETLQRNQGNQRKEVVKNSTTVMKQHAKVLEKENNKLKKEHGDLIKNLQKEHKAHVKTQGKSVSKKDLKVMNLEHNQSVEWQDLLFEQNQARIQFNEQFDKHLSVQDENARGERDMLEKAHVMAWEHLIQTQKAATENLRASNTSQTDYMNVKVPLEEKQLLEKQELQKVQLKETLQLESAQQAALLTNEMRNQFKEHKKQQAKVKEESMMSMKQVARSLGSSKEGKASLKAKNAEENERLNQRFKKENQEFDEKQAKQKAEETQMINNHQAAKQQQQITEVRFHVENSTENFLLACRADARVETTT